MTIRQQIQSKSRKEKARQTLAGGPGETGKLNVPLEFSSVAREILQR